MFVTGRPVKGKQFIDRTKHVPAFKKYMDKNQHLMIKAPRRFGKTSLVRQVFEHQKSYPYIYVDIRRARDLSALSDQIINKAYGLSGLHDFMKRAKESVVDLLESIESLELESIGKITLKAIEKEPDAVEYFLHSLETIEKIAAKKGLNVKFIMDEFQDILTLAGEDALEKMRSVIQMHDHITYVFLGSIESIMTRLFEDKASPLFHFARIIELPGLDVQEVTEYASNYLQNIRVRYDDSLEALIQFLQGHPDYTAQTLQSLELNLPETEDFPVNRAYCISILKEVFFENKAYIEELIAKSKTKKNHYEVLYCMANRIEPDINSKSLYAIRSSLEDIGLIKKESRGGYVITDIFLELYLQQKDDEQLALDGELQLTLLEREQQSGEHDWSSGNRR